MSIWLSQGFNAVSLGSILLLIAIGLTFSFGLMNVINMAHGELIMVGAYVAYVAGLLEKQLRSFRRIGRCWRDRGPNRGRRSQRGPPSNPDSRH